MGNIMINDVCNLKCPYCFANEYVNGDTSTDITYKNFKTAVDWTNRSAENLPPGAPPPRIALIGGEPLLHPQLEDLIKYAQSVRLPGQRLLVFTNGLRLDKYADLFGKCEVDLLINLNSPEDIGIDRYNKTIDNIRLARLKGVNISVGLNLYKKNMDYSFATNLAKELNLKTFRIGLVAPNSVEKKEYGAFQYYRDIKDDFIRLIKELSDVGCEGHLDCQKFPVCFVEEMREDLERAAGDIGVSIENIQSSNCRPVIDILTDLTVVRCFGISDRKYGVPLTSFEREEEVFDYFRTNIDNLGYFISPNSKCDSCKERSIGRCQSGCLSFKMKEIDKILKPVKGIREIE